MNLPQLLLVGDCHAPWCEKVRAALESAGHVRAFARLGDALPTLTGAPPPELVVLLAERPSEHCPGRLLALRRLAPLARMVAVTGPWCEAEGRSGQPLPGVERTAWDQWPRQLGRFLADRGSPRMNLWNAPPTRSRDEVALLESTLACPPATGLLGIAAATSLAYDSLAAACRLAGYATIWLRREAPGRADGMRALIWDAVHLSDSQVAEARQWRRLYPRVPLVAVAGFARPHDLARLQTTGVAAVLSKPLSLEALWWQLARLTAGESKPAAAAAPLVAAA